MLRLLKKVVAGPMDWLLYTVLNEKQRKKLGDLLSQEQKQRVKEILHGKKFLQRKKLRQLKHHLYNLGFTERALEELESFYREVKGDDIKRLVAWELVLWNANKYSKEGAEKALEYLPAAARMESNPDHLRRIAIIKAECHDILGNQNQGQITIKEMLANQKHPDLYLAMANLEDNIEDRLKWMNKAMEAYQLQPISFASKQKPEYDDLTTIASEKKITDGPLISVILPAFKAEDGIQTAIESILSQTWQNVELLVVEDCSPDDTRKVVEEYVAKDKRVKLLSTPQNSGPYVARNIALQAAKGEFVTINDSDDWSHEQKIEKQVSHLIENPDIIANTSGHARLTEDLKLYRRGTPGKYIFPNMSSIMFRREPVMEKVGYWDSVRFAADGEFKRRLVKTFGKEKYVDLETGPLSLPRQSVSSLTGSSAFGYNGFFMGVRKEYVESLEHHHRQADSLYYPYPQMTRPFPVPEPMWPEREEKQDGKRHFEKVIAADFRVMPEKKLKLIKELVARADKRIGLVQMYGYDLSITKPIHEKVRDLLDGEKVHMLVYGEKIVTNKMYILDSSVLEDKQKYIPEVDAKDIKVAVADHHVSEAGEEKLKQAKLHLNLYFGENASWYASENSVFSDDVKELLGEIQPARELLDQRRTSNG
ncbi:glycosyltransferase family 2 protein [Thalassobacillus devorans]|uniref:glycosyltransferase family 2 protein n=1 Tax=Thalassobacillus devorans TaxID=279813 RepID=UPI000A1C97D6|nr:glycosyltransferase family 2 protein [Thalassobacillus devorans]